MEDSLNYPKPNKMFRALVETTPDTVIISDAQSRIIFCNGKIGDTFGYTVEEVLHQDLGMLMPPEYREGHQRGMDRFIRTRDPKLIGKTIEIVGLRKNGQTFPIELSLSYWEEAGNLFFSSIIRDISERKAAEQHLEWETMFSTTILETVDDGIVAADNSGHIILINTAARRMIGGQIPETPVHIDALAQQVKVFYPGTEKRVKWEDLPLNRAILGQKTDNEEMELLTVSGERKLILVSGRRIQTTSGLNLGAVSVFHDITEVRQQEAELREKNRVILLALEELKAAQHSLVQANNELEQRVAERTRELQQTNAALNRKNEELERINVDMDNFIHIASHDLKTPLLNLEALLGLLHLELPKELIDQEAEVLSRMGRTLGEMQETIHNIARVARVQRQEPLPAENLPLNLVLRDIRSNMDELIQKVQAELSADFSAAPEVFFAPVHLKSILTNLLSNALKYRDPDRPLKISLSSQEEGDYVVLAIRDNGLGMDLPRQGHKLFNMFSRLHGHVEGSGVGLYIVKRILENAGGKIEVSSQVGEGTTFRVFLPKKEKAG